MAVIALAGVAPGIGKTAIAEFLLARLDGWHAARVRIGSELGFEGEARCADAGYAVLTGADTAADPEAARLARAGAASVTLLLAEPRGLSAGVRRMLAARAPEANWLVEGNAFLWARAADLAVMVVGPGPEGRALPPVQPASRQLFPKVDVWVWNTRGNPTGEGFFDFPKRLTRRGGPPAFTSRADYHHADPTDPSHEGNAAFLEAVRTRLEGPWWKRESDAFLRRIGFDSPEDI